MNKRKILFIVSGLIVLSLLGVIWFLNNNKAQPLNLPSGEVVSSIEIAGGVQDIICTDKNTIVDFINVAHQAKPTNKKSLQDEPVVPTYVRVDLVYSGGMSSVFLYQENNKWYLEQPYQGIYQTDKQLLDIVTNCNAQVVN